MTQDRENPGNPYHPPIDSRDPGESPTALSRHIWLLFSFSGRINRTQFWSGQFFALAVALFLPVLLGASLETAGLYASGSPGERLEALLVLGIVFLYLWMFFAIQTKRWHDHGKSSSWCLLCAIPYGFGLGWVLWECGIKPGKKKKNRFGPAPG